MVTANHVVVCLDRMGLAAESALSQLRSQLALPQISLSPGRLPPFPRWEQPVKEGWWARLRKRGAVVASATITGVLAGVAGVVVAILLAAGWKP